MIDHFRIIIWVVVNLAIVIVLAVTIQPQLMTYADQLIFVIATLFPRENKGLPQTITVVAFIDLSIEKMLAILL